MIRTFQALIDSLSNPNQTSTPATSAEPRSSSVLESWQQLGAVGTEHSVPSTATQLPVEIIMMIFEVDGTNRDEWLSWSRVCRTWRWVAQTMLSRHADLTTPSLLESFKGTIGLADAHSGDGMKTKLENDHHLRNVVRSMEIIINDKALPTASSPLISSCPNLLEVRLLWRSYTELLRIPADGIDGIHPMPIKKLPQAVLSAWSSVQTLRALYVDCIYQYTPFLLFELISYLPQLEVLGINGQHDQLHIDPDTRFETLARPPALIELHLQYIPLPQVVKWLLSNSSQSLKILDLGRTPIQEQAYHNILKRYGRNLRSLASHDGVNFQPQANNILINLEELIVRGHVMFGLVALLPPTLRHLSLDFASDRISYMEHMLDEVKKTKTLGLLESIGYPYAYQSQDNMEKLSKLCEASGVQLRTSSDRLPSIYARPRLYEQYASALLQDRRRVRVKAEP